MIRIYTTHDRQVDLKLSKSAEWGSFLQHFTGSKEHNIRLREIALKKGFSLSEHGIKIKATGELKKFANEADFYQFLGFALIPPAQRIGGTEFSRYQLK
jgi:DNA polymerase (family 10)